MSSKHTPSTSHYERVYGYGRLFRVISVIVPIAVVCIFGYVLIIASQLETISSGRYIAVAAVTVPIVLVFGWSLQLMYPDIVVMQAGVRLENSFYTSPVLQWEKFNEIRIPETRMVTQIVTVNVDGLTLLHLLVGLSQGMFARAFLIHPRIYDGDRLVRAIYKHRPDLFPNIRKD